MAGLFRYAAFISYSSADARFAKALHRALERYGVPAALGKFDPTGGGKTNRIYPVFRDREELSAGSLGERIEAALKASAALVVVCSPKAAASPWVQKEIEYFIGLGRRDKIYAIIADDAPLTDADGADATSASFPPAFRADALTDPSALEPLAADARPGKDGFRNAWLKVVAGLIGVTPGQIIDRDRRRRARERLYIAGGVAALSALTLLGAAAWDTRTWRGTFTALAESAAGESRLREATALAIAGVNGRGALMLARSNRADERLALSGAARVLHELGPIRGLTFSGDGAKIAVQRADMEQTVAVYDLHTGARRELGALGRLYDVALSIDGERLALRRDLPQRPGAIHDLRTGAVIELGPLVDFRMSGNGAELVIVRADARRTMAVHALKTGAVMELGATGPLANFELSANGAKLVVWRDDARGTGAVYDLTTAAKIELGAFGELEAFHLSADGARLAIRRADPGRTAAIYTLNTGEKTELGAQGVLNAVALSADGAKWVAWRRDQNSTGVVTDVNSGATTELGPIGRLLTSANGERIVLLPDAAQKQRGAFYDLKTLTRTEFALDGPLQNVEISSDGRKLAAHRGERPSTGVAYDLAAGGKIELGELGPLQHFAIAPDGAWLAVRRDDKDRTGAIYALNSPVWTSPSPPKGGDLVAAICAANADAISPLPNFRGGAIDGENAIVGRHLAGRPWNPCDWRGLGAIVPSAVHGDGWFEGARQWLRLVRVRSFGAKDWACEETTSRASAKTRAARADMCARFAKPPVPHPGDASTPPR
jgi:hypothetical protein